MLRRPLTSIELKLDDFSEYESYRREQELVKAQGKTTKHPTQEPPVWNPGPKSKQEIHDRIGYNAPTNTKPSSPIY